MASIYFASNSPSIRGMTRDDDFEFIVTETPTGSSGSESIIELPDASVKVQEVTGAVNTFTVATKTVSLGGGPVTLESATPYQCTIDQSGVVKKGTGGDGPCTIVARSAYGERRMTRQIRTVGAARTFLGVSNYKPGSLAAHVYGMITGYYAGRTASLMQLHLHELDRRSWRANRIAPDLDMSWQSVDAFDGSAFPCSLISPRHALCSAHAGFFVGRSYVFLRPDGTLLEATAKRTWNMRGTDLGLIYFDVPLIGCANAKIAPDIKQKTSLGRTYDWADTSLIGYQFPAFITLLNWYYLPQEVYGGRRLMATAITSTSSWGTPLDSVLKAYAPFRSEDERSDIRGGDSGSCVFFPVIEPGRSAPTSVLMSACRSAYTGPDYSASVNEINAAMNAIKDPDDTTVYAVQRPDLSAFPSY